MGDIGDYTTQQDWAGYSADQHAVWRLLFERQQRLQGAGVVLRQAALGTVKKQLGQSLYQSRGAIV